MEIIEVHFPKNVSSVGIVILVMDRWNFSCFFKKFNNSKDNHSTDLKLKCSTSFCEIPIHHDTTWPWLYSFTLHGTFDNQCVVFCTTSDAIMSVESLLLFLHLYFHHPFFFFQSTHHWSCFLWRSMEMPPLQFLFCDVVTHLNNIVVILSHLLATTIWAWWGHGLSLLIWSSHHHFFNWKGCWRMCCLLHHT